MQNSHVRNVRMLYKTCLKLHRGLPHHLQAIGDAYVRAEFQRHKTANKEHVDIFMQSWAKYAINLTQQLGLKGKQTTVKVGEHFEEGDLDLFSAEQLVQLHELYKETSKATPDDAPN